MLEGSDRRVLYQLLGQVPVVQDPHQGGDQPCSLLAQDQLERRIDRSWPCQPSAVPAGDSTIGRISRVSGPGHEAARRIAASRSGTSISP